MAINLTVYVFNRRCFSGIALQNLLLTIVLLTAYSDTISPTT
jgi:hypothetical protein